MKRQPGGVTLIAVAFLLLGVLSLLWSLFVFGFGGLTWMTGAIFDATGMAATGSANAWQGFVGLLTASVQLVTGFGLLALKRWAWYLAFLRRSHHLHSGRHRHLWRRLLRPLLRRARPDHPRGPALLPPPPRHPPGFGQ